MVHAVRNAVDHGIETAAEREAAGKSPTAKLTLAATRQSGRLVITMSDDGRGVDWEALRAKAARSGLPSTTETELKEALFADGVSTREHANEMSGRGVGLGALRATVVRLGGTVDVWSEPGAGTTFTFAFPDAQAMRPPSMPLRKVG
jgi:two-component system chemotaxis sensor kinase CheA